MFKEVECSEQNQQAKDNPYDKANDMFNDFTWKESLAGIT